MCIDMHLHLSRSIGSSSLAQLRFGGGEPHRSSGALLQERQDGRGLLKTLPSVSG